MFSFLSGSKDLQTLTHSSDARLVCEAVVNVVAHKEQKAIPALQSILADVEGVHRKRFTRHAQFIDVRIAALEGALKLGANDPHFIPSCVACFNDCVRDKDTVSVGYLLAALASLFNRVKPAGIEAALVELATYFNPKGRGIGTVQREEVTALLTHYAPVTPASVPKIIHAIHEALSLGAATMVKHFCIAICLNPGDEVTKALEYAASNGSQSDGVQHEALQALKLRRQRGLC